MKGSRGSRGHPSSASPTDLTIRRYRAASDRAACLDVFDSNVPEFFLPAERAEFEAFLDDLPGPYFVGESGGRIVACGGYALTDSGRRADLCWGMVRRKAQRRGLGRRLTDHRIERAVAHPGVNVVALQTSQHTAAFYETRGFEIAEIEPDGFGPGMDRYDMRRTVAAPAPDGPPPDGPSPPHDDSAAPWVPDRSFGPEDARAAIVWAFPELRVEGVDFIGSGWEFDVYGAWEGGASGWAFRFPRRREYARRFESESELLPLVGEAVRPIHVPQVELRGGPGPHFPYEFAGHRYVEGRSADAPGVVVGDGFARTLGTALARLHATRPSDALAHRLGCDEEGPAEWLEETRGEMQGLRGLGADVDQALAWLDPAPQVPSPYRGPLRLVHNDLCPDHLLVDDDGELVGVLDWTDTTMGDPVLDFIGLYAWRGRAFVEAVLRHYDLAVDDGFRQRLGFSARVRTLHWLHTAIREGGDVSKHRRWLANAFAPDGSQAKG